MVDELPPDPAEVAKTAPANDAPEIPVGKTGEVLRVKNLESFDEICEELIKVQDMLLGAIQMRKPDVQFIYRAMVAEQRLMFLAFQACRARARGTGDMFLMPQAGGNGAYTLKKT